MRRRRNRGRKRMMREGGKEKGRVEGVEIEYGGGSRGEEKRMRRGWRRRRRGINTD